MIKCNRIHDPCNPDSQDDSPSTANNTDILQIRARTYNEKYGNHVDLKYWPETLSSTKLDKFTNHCCSSGICISFLFFFSIAPLWRKLNVAHFWHADRDINIKSVSTLAGK